LVKSVIALFVVIDPIRNVPVFVALTAKMDRGEKKRTSRIAILTAASLLIVFTFGLTLILSFFGINIHSFMIAGGVLLSILSIELLTYGTWRFGADDAPEDKGVVPLAFPLLVGPGAITAVIILFETSGILATVLSIIVVVGITYLTLLFINPINRILGRRGSMIISRVSSVLIAAIAVQDILEGIKNQTF
jgi:multiple antibiotic resistance protein